VQRRPYIRFLKNNIIFVNKRPSFMSKSTPNKVSLFTMDPSSTNGIEVLEFRIRTRQINIVVDPQTETILVTCHKPVEW